MAKFPTMEWLNALYTKLNTDPNYARVAQKWEGDMKFVIDPSGPLKEKIIFYIDLWHGKCRGVAWLTPEEAEQKKSAFTLRGPYDNFLRIMGGKLDPLQAMLTRKINVDGNMMVMMRSVPTVMDFVRCCREITDSFIE